MTVASTLLGDIPEPTALTFTDLHWTRLTSA